MIITKFKDISYKDSSPNKLNNIIKKIEKFECITPLTIMKMYDRHQINKIIFEMYCRIPNRLNEYNCVMTWFEVAHTVHDYIVLTTLLYVSKDIVAYYFLKYANDKKFVTWYLKSIRNELLARPKGSELKETYAKLALEQFPSIGFEMIIDAWKAGLSVENILYKFTITNSVFFECRSFRKAYFKMYKQIGHHSIMLFQLNQILVKDSEYPLPFNKWVFPQCFIHYKEEYTGYGIMVATSMAQDLMIHHSRHSAAVQCMRYLNNNTSDHNTVYQFIEKVFDFTNYGYIDETDDNDYSAEFLIILSSVKDGYLVGNDLKSDWWMNTNAISRFSNIVSQVNLDILERFANILSFKDPNTYIENDQRNTAYSKILTSLKNS